MKNELICTVYLFIPGIASVLSGLGARNNTINKEQDTGGRSIIGNQESARQDSKTMPGTHERGGKR